MSDDWKKYVAEQKEVELLSIIEEESLNPQATRELIGRAFLEGVLSDSGTDISSLMQKKPSRFAPSSRYAAVKWKI